MNWIDEVNFNEEGLVPVIVQDVKTSRVLMLGWANREALESTVATGRGVYFSRSRGQVWCKGESSGNHQVVVGMQLATDGQSVIYRRAASRPIRDMRAATGANSCRAAGASASLSCARPRTCTKNDILPGGNT